MRKNEMQCDKCRNEAVIFQSYSGRHLCGRHLVLDIEARAKRTIRSHRWMSPGDHIAVVVTGDRKSAALLRFLKKLTAGRHDIRLSAMPVSTGMDTLTTTMRVAESLRVPCIEISRSDRKGDPESASVTKLALAFTLDDIAREVLVQFVSGDAERLVHPPSAGSSRGAVICPFIAVPSDEVDRYWDGEGTGIDLLPCTPARDPLFFDAEALFRDYNRRHPATGHALLNIAEELSSCRAVDIAVAAIGRDWSFPRGILTEVTGIGT
jgi:tRNA(Ile)-lysidine synthase TilS/MesJ